LNLLNKTIIITGASRGIGRGIAEALTKEKANLILIARSEEELKKFVHNHGNNHKYYVCDLFKQADIKKVTQKIKKENNKVDILINVAGIGIYSKFEELKFDDWNKSYSLNITAPFLLTQSFFPELQKSENSLVLNIGSGAGVIPMRERSAYCSTKFALRGLTLSLAEEFSQPKFCLITLGATITNFGKKTIEQKEKEREEGQAYFTVDWVASKIVEIIKDDNRKTENVLYPGDFGFGTWKKP
jgi:3-oxoacyl-[acyl-carrier protein] reductase